MGKTTGNDSGQGGKAKATGKVKSGPQGNPGNVIALALASAAKVEPPVGWEPNCKYGLQRIDATPGGRLIRLEDIAEWMAQSLPRKEVIHRLALELVGDDGAGTKSLYVLNSQTFAIPLVADGYPNPEADGFWTLLPWVDRKTLPEYIGRDVCAAWERAWPGLADPRTDQDWKVKRAIANNTERNAREKANRDGVDHPYEDWPDDESLLERLRTLAIPVAKAFELWGYGIPYDFDSVKHVAKQPSAWELLVAERFPAQGQPWTEAQLEAAKSEMASRIKKQGINGVAKAMAKELDIGAEALKKALRFQRKRAAPSTMPSVEKSAR